MCRLLQLVSFVFFMLQHSSISWVWLPGFRRIPEQSRFLLQILATFLSLSSWCWIQNPTFLDSELKNSGCFRWNSLDAGGSFVEVWICCPIRSQQWPMSQAFCRCAAPWSTEDGRSEPKRLPNGKTTKQHTNAIRPALQSTKNKKKFGQNRRDTEELSPRRFP